MSRHLANIRWELGEGTFLDNQYSRVHRWEFDGGMVINGSASPSVVPPPLTSEEAIDPEEALVAATASCHMLWFLALAAKRGFTVQSYTDSAVGFLGKDDRSRISITKIELHPVIRFSGEAAPTREQLQELHHLAHEKCFIANSLRTDIQIHF